MKRKTRRLWSVLLALVMLVSLLSGTMLTAQAQEASPTEYVTFYFNNWIDEYDTIIVYWPPYGVEYAEMEHVGGSVYSAKVPANEILWIEGDGYMLGNPDDGAPGDGYIYYPSSDQWELYNGCPHEWDEGHQITKPTCLEEGLTIYRCLLCDESFDSYWMSMGHDYVDGICQDCGKIVETVTVYLDAQSYVWKKWYVHWWGSGYEVDWPGIEMTHQEGTIYSAEVPVDCGGVSFNDWEDLSYDLDEPTDGDLYVVGENDWHSAACDHEFVDGVCIHCGEVGTEEQVRMNTIYFDNFFQDFDKVYVSWFMDDGEHYVEMTHVSGNIYTAQVPADVSLFFSADGYSGAAAKTSVDGYLYTKDDAWIPYNGCNHFWYYDTGSAPTCAEDGMDLYRCRNCDQSFETILSAYPHNYANGVCVECGATIENSITVYLDTKASNGEGIFVYWWGSDFEVNWPGMEMTHVGGTTYSAEVPEDAEELKFSVDDARSPYLCLPGEGYVYVMEEGRWVEYCAHEYEDGGCIHCGEAKPNDEEYRVYFDLCLQDWEDVYINACTASGAVAPWPGEPMTYEGGTVYSACVPSDCTVLSFNNNDGQTTEDVPLPGNGYVFLLMEQVWMIHNGCTHEWDGIFELGTEPTCTESGSTPYECNLCGVMQYLRKAPYGHEFRNGSCIHCGQIKNGFVEKKDGWYYYQNGELSQTTGLVKYDNAWWYIVKGKWASDTTSLVKHNGEWWYVVDGKVASDITTLVKYNNEWWYVVKGKIASNTTSLVKYNGEWWYVVKGKIAGNTISLVKYNGEWWYVVNGKVASRTTTLVKYNNEWWYVVNGKIASKTTTLVKYNGGWYYLVKGKLAAKTTTLVKYNGVWYYVNKGTVDWGYTGSFVYNGGTYRIVKGRVA